MKLVIDTNILMSSLMKEGKTREIILEGDHNLFSPDFLRSEIKKHEELILDKSNLSHDEFEILLALLLEEIEVIPVNDYRDKLCEAKNALPDPKDTPFLALGIEEDCAIWSDDKDFNEQSMVNVYSTKDLIKKFE